MTYIIKTETAFIFYYCLEGRLIKRVKTRAGLSEEYIIMQEIQPNFTLSITPKGGVYIFAANKTGVTFITEEKNGFSKHLILRHTNSVPTPQIFFDAEQTADGINLIYNIPQGGRGINQLYFHTLTSSQASPVFIDRAFSVQNTPFKVNNIPNLRILFYQKRTSQNNLVYREILSDGSIGGCNTVFSSSAPFSDYSLLVNQSGLYFLAVTNNVFFSHIFFKQRTGSTLSPLRNVADMPSVVFPLLFMHNGKINIFFISAGRPYLAVGVEAPRLCGCGLCPHIAKAYFLDKTSSSIIACEALVNAEKPWEIQLFPFLDEGFFNLAPKQPPKPPLEGGRAVKIKQGEYNFKDFFTNKGGELL